MQNADNLCLKYLLNELEPSEVLMMKKAIEEDEDLLIEVESLRATLRRLDSLEPIDPPARVSESVINKAIEYREMKSSKIINHPFFNRFGSFIAAAVLLIIVFSFSESDFFEKNATDRVNIESSAAVANNSADGRYSTANTNASTSAIKPWIDRNEILHFEDKFNKENASEFDSAFHQSFKKLVPVKYPVTLPNQKTSKNTANIHLTGTTY